MKNLGSQGTILGTEVRLKKIDKKSQFYHRFDRKFPVRKKRSPS